MIQIVKEIIVYSRYDFFVLVFPFGLQIQMVMAVTDNENNNCFEVALFRLHVVLMSSSKDPKIFQNLGDTSEF